MNNKPRVLLNWDTTRKDLLEPFLQMNDDLDIVIIWGEIDEKQKANHPFRQIAFSEYKTPYQLLADIKPERILFFNINSFPQVALNLAAKNKGITTFVMHHGIHHSDQLEMNQQRVKEGLHVARKPVSNFSSLWFYFSALRLRNINQVIPFFRFAWIRQRKDRLLAMEKCVFYARVPDRYINLSPHNAIIIKQVDHVRDDSKFTYIGHPFFDSILARFNELKRLDPPAKEKYFLLIDFANNNNVLQFKLMTPEGKRAFYQRLSSVAKKMGCRLKIKLHPFGFDSPHNYVDDNIDLVKEGDVGELIHHAEKCFSFFSTLIIPIIYDKGSCYVFHIGQDRRLQSELVELGVATKLEALSFTENEIMLDKNIVTEEAYKVFVERYLYYTDGKATVRLKNILAGNEAI